MADTYWDLFAGYTAIWVMVAIFVFKLLLEQRKLSAVVKTLQEKVDRLDANVKQ